MKDLIGRVDQFQRRHQVLGFPLGVVYKFFDDQGGYLAAIVTYYAFIAIFPLMLIASSVLGFVLQGNPKLQAEILESALSQFPIVGTQLGRPEGLQGSTSAVIIGALAAVYGVLGLGQASMNTMNVVWSVPRNSRLNPFLSRLRSLVLIALAGLAILAIAFITSFGSHFTALSPKLNSGMDLLLKLASLLINAFVLTWLFRLSTARRLTWRAAAPGGVAVALMWQLLQYVGGLYVSHVIARASAMNGVFALVLGLIGLIYIASVMAILGVEINVVLDRRLWPRALLTPFTDNVELTRADRRAYEAYAKAQRHKGFQSVSVSFEEDTEDEVPMP
jgi:membrane protein